MGWVGRRKRGEIVGDGELTEVERQENLVAARRVKVAQLWSRRLSLEEIGEKIGVSTSTVFRDLKFIRSQWSAAAVENLEERAAEEITRLNALESEAWEQWDRSKEDAETITSSDANGETRTRKGQSGDPAYIEAIRKIIETRAKFLGLIRPPAPSQTNIQINLPQSRDDLLTEAARLLRDRLDLDPSALLPVSPMEQPGCPVPPAKLPHEPPSSLPPSSE